MRKLLAMLDANRGKGAGFRAEDKDGTAVLYVYDAIGPWGVEAAPFVQAVRGLGAKKIELRVNSPGGDVFDARAMKNALEDFDGEIVAYVDGLAASAASYLMLAADEIVMGEGAFAMIHKAWGLTIGNADEHRAQAALLDKVDDTLVADYVARTGKGADDIRAKMAAETWFTAEEAVAFGLADRVAAPPKRKDKNKEASARWDLSAYAQPPAALIAPAPPPESPADPLALLATERERCLARLGLYERVV
jgi:ATP-dependent Clp protease protease subunit